MTGVGRSACRGRWTIWGPCSDPASLFFSLRGPVSPTDPSSSSRRSRARRRARGPWFSPRAPGPPLRGDPLRPLEQEALERGGVDRVRDVLCSLGDRGGTGVDGGALPRLRALLGGHRGGGGGGRRRLRPVGKAGGPPREHRNPQARGAAPCPAPRRTAGRRTSGSSEARCATSARRGTGRTTGTSGLPVCPVPPAPRPRPPPSARAASTPPPRRTDPPPPP